MRLHMLLGDYPNTHALKQGRVGSSDIALEFAEVKLPHQAFKSVVRELKYDVAELAIVTFLQARAHGKPLVLLPAVVGPGTFQHHRLVYNSERGAVPPAALAGRRVGVRAYSQTSGTWIRGILQEDYGVDPARVHWVTFEDPHVAEYREPQFVQRAAASRELLGMLLAGDLDAAIIGNEPPDDPRIKPLIPDALKAAAAWSRRHGAVPMNHMICVRESISRSHPQVLRELFRLLRESKRLGESAGSGSGLEAGSSGGQSVAARSSGDLDMTPFGVEANRRGLEIIIDYATRQGLLSRRLTVDELFDDTTKAL